MIQLLWRNDRTFDQAIGAQARFYIFTLIAYMNDRTAEGELELFAYVRVESHDVDILNGLILSCLIVETHGFGQPPYRASRVRSGLCCTADIPASSNSHSH